MWAVDPQSSTSTSTTRLPSYSALQLSAVHLTFASLFGGVIMHHISIAVSVVGSPAGPTGSTCMWPVAAPIDHQQAARGLEVGSDCTTTHADNMPPTPRALRTHVAS